MPPPCLSPRAYFWTHTHQRCTVSTILPHESLFRFYLHLTDTTGFDPRAVFDLLYRPICVEALTRTSCGSDYTNFLSDDIGRRVKALFLELASDRKSAAQIHAVNLIALRSLLNLMKTNQICLLCIFRPPKRVLRCTHSICDGCVRIFGHGVLSREDRFDIKSCVLCGELGPNLIDLKPRTAGVRVIVIAEGGCRVVLPLKSLEMLQEFLDEIPLHEVFDFSGETSSGMFSFAIHEYPLTVTGGLASLAIFGLKWDVSRCSRVFEILLRRCFRRSRLAT